MLTLHWPWLLLLFPVPFFIRYRPKSTGTGQLKLIGIKGHAQLQQPRRAPLLLWLIWTALLITIARPMWVGEPIELPSKGRDLMLAVDLSGSMQIEDMQLNGKIYNRFTVTQHVLSEFIERRKGDRLGLILFADAAYLQAPLTQDRRTVAQYLTEAQIGLVGKQTAIGDAIALAVKRFDEVEDSNRVVILLTDGSSNAGSIQPDQAAAIAAERGVTIYTVGLGADSIQQRSFFGTKTVNPSSDLDEAQLKRIADTTNGKYFRARDPQDLNDIYLNINKLEPISRDETTYRPQTELFYYPLAIALFLSVLMQLMPLLNFSRKPTNSQGGAK